MKSNEGNRESIGSPFQLGNLGKNTKCPAKHYLILVLGALVCIHYNTTYKLKNKIIKIKATVKYILLGIWSSKSFHGKIGQTALNSPFLMTSESSIINQLQRAHSITSYQHYKRKPITKNSYMALQ